MVNKPILFAMLCSMSGPIYNQILLQCLNNDKMKHNFRIINYQISQNDNANQVWNLFCFAGVFCVVFFFFFGGFFCRVKKKYET